jgi:alkyl hydroperoxide reductase subunit AhpC
MIGIGQPFPQFEARACVRRRGREPFQSLRHDSFPGKWVIYFFWPKDFTPVCASEIAAFSNLVMEFADRDTQIIGASTDSEYAHFVWSQLPAAPEDLPFPMLSDLRRDLSSALGILDPSEGVAQRATYIVDPACNIRHASVNDFSVGRNPSEILRILDALQTDDLCPSDWEKGQPTVTIGSTAPPVLRLPPS